MKKDTHPKYQDVLFVDTSTGYKFICGSTLQPKEKEKYNGKEYPVYRVAVSSSSHPFFVGGKQYVDTEGRVEKFEKKYQKKKNLPKIKKESKTKIKKK
ncbi:MAG: 50S ribosomal protein L31 [Chlamydiae bacterium SM23_39]|nr:MAG: 50S ribosomal protein L31 [Chlamydiae bacterium SM23_39]